ncbi:MAG: CRTAC1 family protein [Proteobacteria bacterium]|nr:CRTAC1 family protein [Pseudomonadota bacterium]
MKTFSKKLFAPKPIAVAMIALAAWVVYLPKPSKVEMDALASKFSFDRQTFPDAKYHDTDPRPHIFAPRFQHIEAYMSAFFPIGTALVDLTGKGLSDFSCIADPFRGDVQVRSIPGRAGTPISFALSVAPLRFDSAGMRPTGCLPGDYNEDGQTDLLVYFWGRTPVAFLQQTNGEPELSAANFKATELIGGEQTWYTQSMTSADFDGDGHLDLAVANYFADDAKVLNDSRQGDSPMSKGFGSATNGGLNRLIMNQGAKEGILNFKEAEHIFDDPSIGGTQWTVVVGAADMDGDQLPELVFINDHGPDRFLHNRSQPGKPSFALIKNHRDFMTPKSKTFGIDDFHGMGIDFGDLNNDGLLDFGVSNFGGEYLFHQSHFAWINTGDHGALARGAGPFIERSETMGLARTLGVPWDYRLADFDNDRSLEVFQSVGFIRGKINRVSELHENALMNDLAMQFPESWHHYDRNDDIAGQHANALFTRDTAGKYQDVGTALELKEANVSRGIATADVDGDGRVDFLLGNQRAEPTFFHNTSKASGTFLALNIRLPYTSTDPQRVVIREGVSALGKGPPSRAAIGTTVRITLPDGSKTIAAVDGGSGFGGKRDTTVHFGLGNASPNSKIEVALTWRDSKGEKHEGSVTITPGWHTVWLGSTAEFAEVRP